MKTQIKSANRIPAPEYQTATLFGLSLEAPTKSNWNQPRKQMLPKK